MWKIILLSQMLWMLDGQDGLQWETLDRTDRALSHQLCPDRRLLHHLQEQSVDRFQTKGRGHFHSICICHVNVRGVLFSIW